MEKKARHKWDVLKLEDKENIKKAKVDYYCRQYDFRYNRISIRNQSTCWGSCSAQGNLNFSYKIIFLLPEEQDYIVVHELCHLKEQNHSRNFWNLVKKFCQSIKKYTKIFKIKANNYLEINGLLNSG
jgi:predicted metal-dependent hydrolase